MKTQVPASHQIHHQVQILSVLKGQQPIYQEIVPQTLQQLQFVQH